MTRWEQFCVVGIGGHARSKLIPAIQANGQKIVGLVSRQPAKDLPVSLVFAHLEEALRTLPKDTAIVISSAPAQHYAQVCLAIDAGFDVIVEKPAFLTTAEARDVAARCATSQTVLAEAFMQRHTQLYSRLIELCELNQISAINLAFVIPSIPEGTFRNERDLGSSSLFDIGCYIVALINDLGLDIGALDVVGATDPGTASEVVDIAGQCDGIAVAARVGVGADYRNRADVRLSNGSTVGFQPIFYGRPGAKVIGNETICDENAFETMFAVPREHWLVDQQARLAAIVSVTERLEALAQQLARFRAEAT